jgi:hypothetical protein
VEYNAQRILLTRTQTEYNKFRALCLPWLELHSRRYKMAVNVDGLYYRLKNNKQSSECSTKLLYRLKTLLFTGPNLKLSQNMMIIIILRIKSKSVAGKDWLNESDGRCEMSTKI